MKGKAKTGPDLQGIPVLPLGAALPEPVLYDPEIHRKHRAGQYQSPSLGVIPRKLIELPHH